MEVIDQMLRVIPEENTDLRASLGKCRQSALYMAPEVMSYVWRDLAGILQAYILPLTREGVTPEWVNKLGRIIRGEE